MKATQQGLAYPMTHGQSYIILDIVGLGFRVQPFFMLHTYLPMTYNSHSGLHLSFLISAFFSRPLSHSYFQRLCRSRPQLAEHCYLGSHRPRSTLNALIYRDRNSRCTAECCCSSCRACLGLGRCAVLCMRLASVLKDV